MKKVVIALLLVIAAMGGGCAQARSNSLESTSTQTIANAGVQSNPNSEASQLHSTEQESADKSQEDSEMESILRKLVDNNYTCITTMFYYGTLPFDTSEGAGDGQFVAVKSDEFDNIETIRSFLGKTYTQKEVERLITHYIDGSPLYVDDGGALMIDLSQATFAGMPTPWENYTITIVSQTDKKCFFTVEAKYPLDPLREGPNNAAYSFCAVYESGWKLSEMVYKPN